MDTRLSIVDAQSLRSVWPDVRERVAALSAAANEPWIADDVFHEILVGNAYLWVNEGCKGFIVVSILAAPYVRDLHVWIACNDDDETRGSDYVSQLKEIAQSANCSRVIWESPRGGWAREVPEAEIRHLFIVKA